MFVLRTPFIDKTIQLTFKHCLIVLSLFLISHTTIVKAQAPGMLEFSGKAVKNGNALPGATVTVYRNGITQQEQVKTGKNGKFRFYLVFGVDYKITFSAPGCVDMFCLVYTSKLSKDRGDLFPLYQADIPFHDVNTLGVRVDKYKNPFTKIVYDGKKAFKDDESYLANFLKDIVIEPAEQAKIAAEKEAKEQKEKQEADDKQKKEAEEKAKKEAALLAEQKAKEDALREAELARLKAESEKTTVTESQSMETDAIRLQREKALKEQQAKKNKEIKTNYENDLLKMVAENERSAKQKAFVAQKQEARANTVIEQMRRENDLKAKADKLIEEQKAKQKLTLENKQYKSIQMKKLVEAAAFAERSVKIGNQKTLPDVKNYSQKPAPNVLVKVDEGFFKTTRTTVVTQDKKMDTYRKETYMWGTVYCYKNDVLIQETLYNSEIDYFLSYINK